MHHKYYILAAHMLHASMQPAPPHQPVKLKMSFNPESQNDSNPVSLALVAQSLLYVEFDEAIKQAEVAGARC